MPITPPPTTPPDQKVTSSDRLWSEEVGIARGLEQPQSQRDIKYEWSNGRKFEDGFGPYVP